MKIPFSSFSIFPFPLSSNISSNHWLRSPINVTNLRTCTNSQQRCKIHVKDSRDERSVTFFSLANVIATFSPLSVSLAFCNRFSLLLPEMICKTFITNLSGQRWSKNFGPNSIRRWKIATFLTNLSKFHPLCLFCVWSTKNLILISCDKSSNKK